MPPIISSETLSEAAAREVHKEKTTRQRLSRGYDAVEYKLTRHNGVPRVLSIPHPKAYAGLTLALSTNWQRLNYITRNKISTVIPRRHSDGRLAIMDYDTAIINRLKRLDLSFGFRYIVRSDIANFYPSIYSHSLPWAIVGLDQAKKSIGTKKTKWYDKLDKAIRLAKRSETNGVAVGPGTSIVIAEALLAKVDRRLVRKKYTFIRSVDDYVAFCRSEEQAERFILDLSDELAQYRLILNRGKTSIQPLPLATTPDWIVELEKAIHESDVTSSSGLVRHLDFATSLARSSPDGSVLKYALRSIINKMPSSVSPTNGPACSLMQYALNLSFHHPILVPLLKDLFASFDWSNEQFSYDTRIQELMTEHLRLRHSDAVSWLLYFSIKYGVPVTDHCAKEIVKSLDCISMLLLYLTDNQIHRNQVVRTAKRIVKDKDNLYRIDQYWLLLYQMYLDSKVPNPYAQSSTFDIMKKHGVSFVDYSA